MTISSKWHGIDLNDDQLTMLDWLRQFCEKEIRPAAAKYDKSQETPWDIIKKAADSGIYSLEFFGQLFFGDPTGVTAALAIEELFFADPGIALALFGTGLPAAAIMANGTDAQKMEWLPKCFVGAKGEPVLAAFATSESGAGSDVSGMRTRAVYNKKNDTWTINGTKDWITNGAISAPEGGITGLHVVVAVVDAKLGSRGQASFIVPAGTQGLSQGTKHHKLGFRASHTAEVVFDNVVVPGNCLLGGKEALEGRLVKARAGQSSGGQAAMATFEGTRWMVAAMGVGLARAAYEHARDYAVQREQFGKPIAQHQQVALMLAELDTNIDAARLLVIDAAHKYMSGAKLLRAEGSKAKYFATELAVKATRYAVQILGGAGYVDEHPVERWYRDAPLLTIFEGTTQVQVNLIASVGTGLRIR
jgi:hypothetical protein